MGWRKALGFRQSSEAAPRAARQSNEDPASMDRWRNVKVVGESHYQAALWSACGAENTGEQIAFDCGAELVPEPDNPVDPRAIMVQVDGRCVGYLSRGSARLYGKRVREMREAGQRTNCDAFIGGLVRDSGNPNLGITLKFPVDADGGYKIEPGGAEISKRVLDEHSRRG